MKARRVGSELDFTPLQRRWQPLFTLSYDANQPWNDARRNAALASERISFHAHGHLP
jgi:hypothetical protein